MDCPLSARLGALSRRALEAEVSATPKPGLVDRLGNGAHKDMDYPMFIRSAAALEPHFAAMTEAGFHHPDFRELLPLLRRLGLAAERDMYAATGGVNTHKGAIFSLGLLCGCAGRRQALELPRDSEALCEDVARMTAGICQREYAGLETKKNPTKGERMYLRYGVTGARGQAEGGFEAARTVGLPALQAARREGKSDNDACLAALLALMAHMIDTNVLARRDMETALWLKNTAASRQQWSHAQLEQLDALCVGKNVSPGGCADMVALSWWLEGYPL